MSFRDTTNFDLERDLERCGCGWRRPLIGLTMLDGSMPPDTVVPVYQCPECSTLYVSKEIPLARAQEIFAEWMLKG